MAFRQFQFNHPILKDRRRNLRSHQTEAEKLFWRKVRNKQLGFKFWRQYSVGPFILDFYCPAKRLAIELDGQQHTEEKSIEYDQERSLFLKSYGIQVLRFWNYDIFKNIDGVLEMVCTALEISPPKLPLN